MSSELPVIRPDAYTSEIQDVIESEKIYLTQRRNLYNLPPLNEGSGEVDKEIWGLAISGGGVRSATLGLGMIQKFIVEGIFKKFDYMSTVGGGGYIGACLSSLMNTDPDKFVRPQMEVSDESTQIIPGLDTDTSPFVLLYERQSHVGKMHPRGINPETHEDESVLSDDSTSEKFTLPPLLDIQYKSKERTKINAQNQVNHLRKHTQFLNLGLKLKRPDLQGAIGTVYAGIIHNFVMYTLWLVMMVSFTYILFDEASAGDFFKVLEDPSFLIEEEQVGALESAIVERSTNDVAEFWNDRMSPFFSEIMRVTRDNSWIVWGVIGSGFFISMLFQSRIPSSVRRIKANIIDGNLNSIPSGFDIENYSKANFASRFQMITILGGIMIPIVALTLGFSLGVLQQPDYWLLFSLPACYAIGYFLGVYLAITLINSSREIGRIERSLLGSMGGGVVIGILALIFIPLGSLLIFAFSFWIDSLSIFLDGKTYSLYSLASVFTGYLVIRNQGKSISKQKGFLSGILSFFPAPLFSLFVLVFTLLTIILTIVMLKESGNPYSAEWAFGGALLLILFLGSIINPNKLSLHSYSRDRLVEAFLRTNGAVLRDNEIRQGMPMINLRDDEHILLKNLAWKKLSEEKVALAKKMESSDSQQDMDFRFEADGSVFAPNPNMPYHLISTSLDLKGSVEMIRKDHQCDHFIFSRNYIGSRTTGYVQSEAYRDGQTELATAMTISGAGFTHKKTSPFFSILPFLNYLLNTRAGYWMENPWFYRYLDKRRVEHSRLKALIARMQGWKKVPTRGETENSTHSNNNSSQLYFDPKRKFTFWPSYLLLELFGGASANTRLIKLSDGGNTGDNLGLIPLLRRRCKVIVVCDFEQDGGYHFESFNHVARTVLMEENISIEIDLRPLLPQTNDEEKEPTIECNVVEGTILYPDQTNGRLFYLKSSISLKEDLPFPMNVFFYKKKNPNFPHQTNINQHFDDAQFEAYRRLGFHIAGEASSKIRQFIHPIRSRR